jgi:predicted AlkP superfamily pyrophosphatase or phosphodiesterase
MRGLVVASTLVMAWLGSFGLLSAQTAQQPRLAVLIVVDQMRADYLLVLQKHWAAGFKTLLSEGAIFDRAAYPYLNTVTCAGHTTIGTGAFPNTHGLIGNEWWDVQRNELVDCTITDDPQAAHVSYGLPVGSGNSPKLLRVPSLADRLRTERPGARVVSLSMKPDAAIGMAGHGGDLVTWFDYDTGAFLTSKAFTSVRSGALATFLLQDSYRKEIGTPWRLAKPAHEYVFADANLGERPPGGRDGLFPHNTGSVSLWRQSPMSDRYLGRIAVAMIEALQLGADDVPDMLAVSFSALDYLGHAHGPDSREVEDVLINLDQTLGDLIAALDRNVGRGRYVLAMTADHGVVATPRGAAGGRLIREDIQELVEEILTARWGTRSTGVYVPSVYSNYVYFAPGIFDRLRSDKGVWNEVLLRLNEVPGIARVLSAAEVSATSADATVRAAALSYMPGRGGDLILIPEPNWIVLGRGATAATNHGSSSEYEQRVPLVFFGAGVRAGRYAQSATPADVAPTVAQLLSVTVPHAEGRVLREALR